MIGDVWKSFWRLPAWVKVWMVGILVPVNLASVFFISYFAGQWIAGLAIAGMAFNIPIMLKDRGMSKLMALPHLVFWIPAVLLAYWILSNKGGVPSQYVSYLRLLIGVNLVSLAFDIPDFVRWLRGDREIA